jgi:hypothetical protein
MGITSPDRRERGERLTAEWRASLGEVGLAPHYGSHAGRLQRLLSTRIDFERIRQDHILPKRSPAGADPLRLALVFGIDHSTAMTYARLARQILTDHEPAAFPGPDRDSTGRFDPHHLQSG